MNLRVSLCQTEAAWRDPIGNLRRAEPLVAAAAADLVVLPELFATGFDVAAAAVEPEGGPVADALRGWALRYGRAIAGSVAVREADGTLRNRMYFVRPSGEAEWYDKRHLFRPGGEAAAYAPGSERRVVHYRGWRLLLLVCYDLRFPVWSRCRGDYDAIVCCAAWPAPRRAAWRTLVRARAIENQCYVAAVNRAGADPGIVYAGDSALVDFRGEATVEAGCGVQTLTATWDREALEAFRARFPAWRDADGFRLEE
ncbi:nitrilase-related carbon-nitrogen hydrolase [uncultured Alistipes sp.]|uniref:nitrilase-related carbon-nitrogen hydrolase n=1 Tax=uncultured Alistipes sp. TaxID=538949 RepID=UPI00260DB3C4|nr:nitrilase-related carbon-nitrogen hydrolase [uncultured Alistipes sp.]